MRKTAFVTFMIAAIGVPTFLVWQARASTASDAASAGPGSDLPGFIETDDFSFVLPDVPIEDHSEGAFAGRTTLTTSWTVDTGALWIQVSATSHGRTLHADLAQIAISTTINGWTRDQGGFLASEQEFETDAGTARRAVIDMGGGRIALNEQYAHGPWMISIWAVGVGLTDAHPEYAALIDSLNLR